MDDDADTKTENPPQSLSKTTALKATTAPVNQIWSSRIIEEELLMWRKIADDNHGWIICRLAIRKRFWRDKGKSSAKKSAVKKAKPKK